MQRGSIDRSMLIEFDLKAAISCVFGQLIRSTWLT
jgi:hypothetical protein